MDSFHLWWLIFAALLLAAAGFAGKKSKCENVLGILVDARGRFSMNRMQVVLWNILILSTFLGLVFSTWNIPEIPPTLVGLLGISIGSGVMAGMVKAGKDQDATAKVAKHGTEVKSDSGEITHTIQQHPRQMVMVEEGSNADRIVDVGKFQNAVFTVGLAVTYIAMTWNTEKFPVFNTGSLWLLGLSHAGYVGGKIPNQGGGS